VYGTDDKIPCVEISALFRRTDGGAYTCTAFNTLGNAQAKGIYSSTQNFFNRYLFIKKEKKKVVLQLC
jgi:hypothetical protein